MLELKPTIFTSVPRLYNRIYDRVMGTIRAGNPVARRLFAMAYASKRAALEQGDLSGGRFGPFWDRLVFSKIKARLGGASPMHAAKEHWHAKADCRSSACTTKNACAWPLQEQFSCTVWQRQTHGITGEVRIMTTGSAPISSEVMEFLRVCFGAVVIEGYGMAETACTITMTHPDDTSCGHVGGPLPCCEIKLADLPDMKYMSTDRPHPRGEVSLLTPVAAGLKTCVLHRVLTL